MARLQWGQGPPMYDQGVDQGVLYLDGVGVPWNGLVSVDESALVDVNTDYYFEGRRLHVTAQDAAFEAKVSAYTYPDAFAEYNGYSEHKSYQRFGLSYRTEHGAFHHRLHLVYNVLVQDDSRSWGTIKQQIDPSLFNWAIFASPVPIPGASPASHLILEIPDESEAFDDFQDILYGTDTTDARLPDPEELVVLFESATLLRIIYHGDGSYSAIGPDDMVQLLDDGRFALNAPSVQLLGEGRFSAKSL